MVENAPDGDKEILDMLIKYKNQNLKDAAINKDAYSFTVFLYEKNNSTSYFIENADDPGGLTSQVLQDSPLVLVCDEYLLTFQNNTKRLQRGSIKNHHKGSIFTLQNSNGDLLVLRNCFSINKSILRKHCYKQI